MSEVPVGSQHGKQKIFLRIQNGINPTQDPIYEMPVAKMVRSNLLPSKINKRVLSVQGLASRSPQLDSSSREEMYYPRDPIR